MKQKLPILFLLAILSLGAAAQPAALNCSTTGRYVSDIFPTVVRDTTIVYGFNYVTNYTTVPPTTNIPATLKLNLYQPQGDAATKRPLIIMAFGGSFYFGTRFDLDTLCTRLARKGYTTASIDYRLIYPTPANIFTVYSTPALLADEVVKACADMKAAVRYLKTYAATYRIDTTKIFIGGYSAGAITALQTAYTDSVNEDLNPLVRVAYANNGGIEGNTEPPGMTLQPAHNSKGIAGVLSIAGGVSDTFLIDAPNPPLYMAHGTQDETVAYNYGAANGTTFFLYGGGAMNVRANSIGLRNQLLTINGGNHASPTIEPNFTNIITGSSAFFQPIVCAASPTPVSLLSFSVENSNCAAALQWQTAAESNSSRYEVEVSADGRKYMKVGEVKSKNAATGASYKYTYKSFDGTSFYRLKMVDADGSYTYSPVQKLSLPCNLTTIQVYPNPAKDQTLITGLKSGMQVQLLNAQGQKLWQQKAGAGALQIPLSQFTSGLYLVQVTDETGKTISNTRLIKE